jgi:hypothetical protein
VEEVAEIEEENTKKAEKGSILTSFEGRLWISILHKGA